MNESKDDLLSRVGGDKRDFLKKLAIVTAYAAPVMTSFSLDSIRASARAQGSYFPDEPEEAVVVGAAFIAAAGPGSLGAGALPAELFGTLRVMFSKPMATSLNTCKRAAGTPCEIIISRIDVLGGPGALADVDLSDGWTWRDDMTEEKQIFTPVSSVAVQFNTAALICPAGEQYRARDGGHLAPYEAVIDTESCEDACEPPDCVIESKLDEI